MKLTRKQIRTIRQMFRRAFGLTARSRAPTIVMTALSSGLRVQAATEKVAVEYFQPGDFEPTQLCIPYQALLDCEGTRSEPVTFQEVGGELQVDWNSEGIPVALRYPLEEIEPFPPMPQDLYHNDARMLGALRDACETTEKSATRYALDHLRLRGSDGQIASTDGRQALVQAGFTFPWEEALLVPATNVYAAKELQKIDVVKVGRTENWVTIQMGSWTFHLKIDHEGRFPNLDDCIPDSKQATTSLNLAKADADFLSRTLGQLPAADLHDRPVTLDLNGAAILRAKGEDQPTTEILLTNSTRTGNELRVACNRDYLARAVTLGFQEVHLTRPDSPALCQDDTRRFIWALFAKGSALEPNDQAVRITSPSTKPISPGSRENHRKRSTGSQEASKKAVHPQTPGGLRGRLAELIQRAEDLLSRLEQRLDRLPPAEPTCPAARRLQAAPPRRSA